MDVLDPKVRDCRKDIREEVQKRGRLVTTWQQYGILVDVKDISRFGARIHLDAATKLPPTFELWLDDEGIVHRARICWRLHNQIGVEFAGHPARVMTKRLAEVARYRDATDSPGAMPGLEGKATEVDRRTPRTRTSGIGSLLTIRDDKF